MPDMNVSYGIPLDFIAFFWEFFTQLTTCPMGLQVMENLLILLYFLGICQHNSRQFVFVVLYLHQTFLDCVANQYTNFYILTCQM